MGEERGDEGGFGWLGWVGEGRRVIVWWSVFVSSFRFPLKMVL